MQVRVERQGRAVLDDAVADLLLAVERTHSISAAARAVGVSYRHAWLLLQEANQRAGQPLVATAVGGRRGGGAELTELGRTALAVFHQVDLRIREAAGAMIPRIVAPADGEPVVLHLAAAISLQEVIALALSEYALVRPTAAVRTIFGGSHELADQVAGGSPIDLFISASGEHIDRLAKAGLVVEDSTREMAANSLAVVGPRALIGKVRRPADLARATEAPIYLADPACPLGRYTDEFLRANRLVKDLTPRIRLVGNSRAVVAALRATEDALGVIFGSDGAQAADLATLLSVPASQVKAEYQGAVIATSSAVNEARELLAFLASREGKRCFRRCGFQA